MNDVWIYPAFFILMIPLVLLIYQHRDKIPAIIFSVIAGGAVVLVLGSMASTCTGPGGFDIDRVRAP